MDANELRQRAGITAPMQQGAIPTRVQEGFGRKALKARRAQRAGVDRSGVSDDPYYQGDAAAHAQQPITANPYPEGSEEHADWAAGWSESAAVNEALFDPASSPDELRGLIQALSKMVNDRDQAMAAAATRTVEELKRKLARIEQRPAA